MDYKALRQRASAFAHVVEDCGLGAVPFDVDGINIVALPTSDILALCDAVEALEKDRERLDRVAGYERMAQSSRITVICRSVPDVNLFAEMLSDAISRTASSPAPTASTPTPAAPSDA